jgi:hypothetical protein
MQYISDVLGDIPFMMPILSKTGLNKTLRELLEGGNVEWLSIRDGEESDLIVVGIRVAAEALPQGISSGATMDSPSH